MSASRDSNQKPLFVYTNLYQVYKKGKSAASSAATPSDLGSSLSRPLGIQSGKVIKAGNAFETQKGFKIERHEPPRFLTKQLKAHRPSVNALETPRSVRADAVQGLRDNLKTLKGLHDRLHFMLKELEEIANNKK